MQDQTITAPAGLITVRGEAKLCVPPDVAEIFISVSSRGETPKEAVEKLEKTTNEIRKAIRKAALSVRVLRLTSLQVIPNVNKVAQPDSTYQEIPKGYIASQEIRLNLPLRSAGYLKVMESLAKNCPDAQPSLHFIVKKTSTVERNLLRLATKNAASDAKTLAKTLGLKIDGINSVEKGRFAPLSNIKPLLATANSDSIKPTDIEFSLTVLISFLTAPTKQFAQLTEEKTTRLSKRKVNSKPVQ